MPLQLLSCRAARHVSAQIQQHAEVLWRLLKEALYHRVRLLIRTRCSMQAPPVWNSVTLFDFVFCFIIVCKAFLDHIKSTARALWMPSKTAGVMALHSATVLPAALGPRIIPSSTANASAPAASSSAAPCHSAA